MRQVELDQYEAFKQREVEAFKQRKVAVYEAQDADKDYDESMNAPKTKNEWDLKQKQWDLERYFVSKGLVEVADIRFLREFLKESKQKKHIAADIDEIVSEEIFLINRRIMTPEDVRDFFLTEFNPYLKLFNPSDLERYFVSEGLVKVADIRFLREFLEESKQKKHIPDTDEIVSEEIFLINGRIMTPEDVRDFFLTEFNPYLLKRLNPYDVRLFSLEPKADSGDDCSAKAVDSNSSHP